MFKKITYPRAWAFILICLLQLGTIAGLFVFSGRDAHLEGKKQLMQRFHLSDYCLSTESRHVRHISQPELLAPFQDLPAYHEHFPSSSFFPKPTQK